MVVGLLSGREEKGFVVSVGWFNGGKFPLRWLPTKGLAEAAKCLSPVCEVFFPFCGQSQVSVLL